MICMCYAFRWQISRNLTNLLISFLTQTVYHYISQHCGNWSKVAFHTGKYCKEPMTQYREILRKKLDINLECLALNTKYHKKIC
jgi:hypothetical protein